MNKFAKALLLTIVIAAPVATIASAVQAAPASHTIAASKANYKHVKHHHHKGYRRASTTNGTMTNR